MKIAFIHNLPSGGAKRSAFRFVQHLVTNHTVDLFYIDPASERYLDLRPLVRRAVFVEGPTVQGRLDYWTAGLRCDRAYHEIARQVNKGGYDLAFVMQCRISNSPGVLRFLKVPSLYFCHEPLSKSLEPHYWPRGGVLKALKVAAVKWKIRTDRINARFATVLCGNSRYSVENLYRAYGIVARFNQMGVDAEDFQVRTVERQRVVLSVGQLGPAKGQDFIIESIGTLAKQDRPEIQFIYNSGFRGYRAHLELLAAQRGVVASFRQLVGQAELVEAYSRAAIFAFASHLEPLGLVTLEAMACETPVVGVAEAGIRETVMHGKTGILTERDPDEFGRAIELLLANERLRVEMGLAGRRDVKENWTWEKSYEMLDRNLRRAADGLHRETANGDHSLAPEGAC